MLQFPRTLPSWRIPGSRRLQPSTIKLQPRSWSGSPCRGTWWWSPSLWHRNALLRTLRSLTLNWATRIWPSYSATTGTGGSVPCWAVPPTRITPSMRSFEAVDACSSLSYLYLCFLPHFFFLENVIWPVSLSSRTATCRVASEGVSSLMLNLKSPVSRVEVSPSLLCPSFCPAGESTTWIPFSDQREAKSTRSK